MKIATYNVNSIRIRLDTIMGWLDKHKPDVLCIQETKCQDDVFPALRSTLDRLLRSLSGNEIL